MKPNPSRSNHRAGDYLGSALAIPAAIFVGLVVSQAWLISPSDIAAHRVENPRPPTKAALKKLKPRRTASALLANAASTGEKSSEPTSAKQENATQQDSKQPDIGPTKPPADETKPDPNTNPKTPNETKSDPNSNLKTPAETQASDPAPNTPKTGAPEVLSAGDVNAAEIEAARLARLPPFSDVCFQDFDYETSGLDENGLKEWFEPVQGKPFAIQKHDPKYGDRKGLQGFARFKKMLPSGVSLRLSLMNFDNLRFHFRAGEAALTVICNPGDRWAAYVSRFKPENTSFEPIALCAFDKALCRNTESRFGGPFELRHEGEEIILSRGDIIIFRAPLAQPPAEIFLEGNAIVLGIALVESRDFPAAMPQRKSEFDLAKPAEANWKVLPADGAAMVKTEEGAAKFVAKKDARSYATLALPNFGPAELVLQLRNVSPGAGVYLSNGGLATNFMYRFMNDRKTNRITLQDLLGTDETEADPGQWAAKAVGFCDSTVWMKIIFASGVASCWISPDGQHWAECETNRVLLLRPITEIGLFCPKSPHECSMTLARLQLRPLPAIAALTPPEVLAQAPELSSAVSYVDWLAQVNASQPPTVDVDRWRRACAIKSFGRGLPLVVGQPVLDSLISSASPQQLPAAQSLALLGELSLLVDLNDVRQQLKLTEAFLEVGEAEFRRGETRPWSLVRPAYMAIAFPNTIKLALDRLARLEILSLAYQNKIEELGQMCARMKFLQQHQDQLWGDWAEVTTGQVSAQQQRRPNRNKKTPTRARKAEWLPLVVEDNDRDAYTTLSEIRTLLANGDPREAGATVAEYSPVHMGGLAEDDDDSQVSIMPEKAIALVFERSPELREAMHDHFSQLASLRLQRAMLEANERAAQLVAIQFVNTPARREALAWLAQRCLTAGRFYEALAYFREARAASDSADSAGLAAGERLAAAFVGKSYGEPATESVRLGNIQIEPKEFEEIVARAQARTADLVTVAPQPFNLDLLAAPRPASFSQTQRARLEGEVGEKAKEAPAHFITLKIPWAEWYLGTCVHQNCLYISNRFHVAAYDLEKGVIKWRTPAPGGFIKGNEKAAAHEWPLVPMRPIAIGQRLLCRQLNRKGTELVCLNRDDGVLVWRFQGQRGMQVISDPVVFSGEVWALCMTPGQQLESTLVAKVFSLETGEQLREYEWLRLRNHWIGRRVCSVAVRESKLVAVLGGAMVCGDLATGRVQWVRQQPWLAQDVDPDSRIQRHEQPLVLGDSVAIVQPGVRAVERIAIDNGHLLWRTIVPGIRGWAGRNEKSLFVTTGDQIIALDAENGKRIWQRDLHAPVSAFACDNDRVVYGEMERIDPESKLFRPRLIWIDAKTGNDIANTALDKLTSDEPALQFAASHGNRLWAWFGNCNAPDRDLIELVPSGPPLPPPPPVARSVWTSQVPRILQEGAAIVLPSWEVVAGGATAASGYREEFSGKKNVFAAEIPNLGSLAFARWVERPLEPKQVLRIHLQTANGAQGSVEANCAGIALPAQAFDGDFGGKWQEVVIPLDAALGKSGWLQVKVTYAPGAARPCHIHSLRIDK